jgi:hypothetical protein
MIEVQLTASDFELELYVDGYEFPDFDTGRDGNALACEIELDLRQRLDLHAAHSQLILYTFELANFVDQLRALEHAHDGEATLGDPDPQSGDEFGLTIRLKDDGQGTARWLPRRQHDHTLQLRDDRHRSVVPQRHARAVRDDRRRLPGPRRHRRRLSRDLGHPRVGNSHDRNWGILVIIDTSTGGAADRARTRLSPPRPALRASLHDDSRVTQPRFCDGGRHSPSPVVRTFT